MLNKLAIVAGAGLICFFLAACGDDTTPRVPPPPGDIYGEPEAPPDDAAESQTAMPAPQ